MTGRVRRRPWLLLSAVVVVVLRTALRSETLENVRRRAANFGAMQPARVALSPRMHAHLGLVLALLVTATWACSDSQHHLSAPARTGSSRSSGGGGGVVRPLPWGQVQVLSTTDIHGWYQGHLKKTWPEPNYSGDWGDFASFVTRAYSNAQPRPFSLLTGSLPPHTDMRALARRRGVDLLVVDSGDLHDGAGLSDGYIKGQGPDAHVSNQFHAMVAFDVL